MLDAAAGAKIFVDQKGSLCHSVAGKGNTKGALDDVDSLVAYMVTLKKK
jgi:hypothetical protein